MRKHFLLDLSKLLVCFTAAFLLASCRDVTNGAVTGSSYGERLTVNLTAQAEDGLGNIVDLSNSSSRSILPSTFDARDLAFRISGFSRKGKFVGTSAEDEVAIEFESHEFTSGTTKPAAAQELTFDIWELTLTAYKTDDTEYISDRCGCLSDLLHRITRRSAYTLCRSVHLYFEYLRDR